MSDDLVVREGFDSPAGKFENYYSYDLPQNIAINGLSHVDLRICDNTATARSNTMLVLDALSMSSVNGVSMSQLNGYTLVQGGEHWTYGSTSRPVGFNHERVLEIPCSVGTTTTSSVIRKAQFAERTDAPAAETWTNLITNPSFETSATTGWSNTNQTSTQQAVSGDIGSYACRMTANSSANTSKTFTYAGSEGKTYTFMGKYLGKTGSGDYRLVINVYDESDTQVVASVYSAYVSTLSAGAWVRVSVTAPSTNVGNIRAFVYGTTITVGATCDWDGFMLVEGDEEYDGRYFDGAQTDAYHYQFDWSGTAHASTSTMTRINTETDRQWVNLALNPSAEDGSPPTGWSAYGSGGTTATLTREGDGKYGSYVARVTASVSTGTRLGLGNAGGGGFWLGRMHEDVGFTVGLWVRPSSGLVGAAFKWYGYLGDAGGFYSGSGYTIKASLAAGWQWVHFNLNDGIGVTNLSRWLSTIYTPYMAAEGTVDPGDYIEFDGMVVVEGDYDGDFFDGDADGCFWTGTAHASTSVACTSNDLSITTIDISEMDYLSIALPAYPASSITENSSYIDLTSNVDGDFTEGPTASIALSTAENPLSDGDTEALFALDEQTWGSVNLSQITGVQLRLVASANCTVYVQGIRATASTWDSAPLDINTRTGELERPPTRTGDISNIAFPAATPPISPTDWPILYKAESPTGQADPQPINAHMSVLFNTGSKTAASGEALPANAFDGSTGFVGINDNNLLDTNLANGATWICWFKPQTLGSSYGLFGKAESYYCSFANNKLNWAISTNGSTFTPVCVNDTTLAIDTWYMAAGTYDGSALTVFLNGDSDGSTARTGTIYNSSTQLRIGQVVDASAWFHGAAAHFALFGRALSSYDIQRLYSISQTVPGSLSDVIIAESPNVYFPLDETGGNFTDIANSLTGTRNGGVTGSQNSFYTDSQQNTFSLFFRELASDAIQQEDIDDKTMATLDELGLQPDYFKDVYTEDIDPDDQDQAWLNYRRRTQAELNEFIQDQLEGETQTEIERVADYLQASWIEVRISWDDADQTLTIVDTNNEGYAFTLPTLSSNAYYVLYARLEDYRLQVMLYEWNDELQVIGDLIFNTNEIEDDFVFTRRKGRLGWYAKLLDGDAAIRGIEPRFLNFAEYQSSPIQALTPIKGVALRAAASPDDELFTGVWSAPLGGTISLDIAKSNSGQCYRIENNGQSPLQGIQTNQFLVSNLNNVEITFEVLVPAKAVEYAPLVGYLSGDTGQIIPINLGQVTPDRWHKVFVALDDDPELLTGKYRLVLVQPLSGVATTWWLDRVSIRSRLIEWFARPVLEDAWGSGAHEWMPFKNTVNDPTGGVFFESSGLFTQVRGRALSSRAQIGNLSIIPKYAELGRIPDTTTFFERSDAPEPETWTNLVTNPSFENDTTGWSDDAGCTISRVTSPSGKVGSGALRMTHDTASGDSNAFATTYFPAVPGKTYTMLAKFLARSNASRDYKLRLTFYSAGPTNLISYYSDALTPGAWCRMSKVAPPEAAFVRVHFYSSSSGSISDTADWDAVLLVEGDEEYGGAYFDGSFTDSYHHEFDWTGTAHASTSTMTRINTETDRQWVNLFTNPSAEVDASGWNTVGTETPYFTIVSGQNSGWAANGSYSMYCKFERNSTASGTGRNAQLRAHGYTDAGNSIKVIPGRSYTVRASVNILQKPTSGNKFSIQPTNYDAGGNVVSYTGGIGPYDGPLGHTDYEFTYTAPDNTAFVSWAFIWNQITTTGEVFELYVDSLSMVEGDFSDGSYFDGDTTGCFWTGTEHESASVAVQLEKPLKDLTQPQAVISVTDGASSGYIVCDGSKSTGNANIVYYEWLFDDGTNMVGQVVTKLFSIGTHTIELRIIDANGQIGYTKTTKVVS